MLAASLVLLFGCSSPAGPTGVEAASAGGVEARATDRYAALNASFVFIARPHSGPSRANRGKRYGNQPRGLVGISRGEAPWLVGLTNDERINAGLAPFAPSAQLMDAARIQATQMAALGQMSHVLPAAKYPSPEDRLAAVGYEWQAYAENVAYGQGSPAGAIDSWMHSSGHRANILNPALTELGTGFARDASGRPYYVQVFGRPR